MIETYELDKVMCNKFIAANEFKGQVFHTAVKQMKQGSLVQLHDGVV